ncbi:MAG: GNAT family N-acetyltransferase, partial [Finegoldia magna]|nr:GNAT family N-acetyltransferase [Finegoldia magna]
YYDLGGVKSLDINNGLYRFKRKFTNNNIIKWIGNIECVIDEDSYQKFIENKDDRDYSPELKGNIAD